MTSLIHVIDDDEAVRHSLTFLLECADFAVKPYDSARAFLDALPADGRLPAGAIVTDVRMPDMTGIELIAQLRRRAVTTPVIVITGHADVSMAIQAMKAGVHDFIEKPFSDEAILSAVRDAAAKGLATAGEEEKRRDAEARIASLSQRERDVLDGLVEGKPNKVIAYDLGISVRTVEVYRANLMTKMRVRSLSELVRDALSVRPA